MKMSGMPWQQKTTKIPNILLNFKNRKKKEKKFNNKLAASHGNVFLPYILLGQQFTCEKGIGQSETVTVQEERQF
jgi:hypothetical protein